MIVDDMRPVTPPGQGVPNCPPIPVTETIRARDSVPRNAKKPPAREHKTLAREREIPHRIAKRGESYHD